MVQVAQQWLSHTRKATSPAVTQSMRLISSAVPVWHRRPGGFPENCWPLVSIEISKKLVPLSMKECHSSRIDELPCVSRGDKQAKGNMSFLHALLSGLPPEGVAYPASNNLTEKVPHRCAQPLGFLLIPEAAQLTTKITHLSRPGP